MKKTYFTEESSVLYQNRFCEQENFDFIITGLSVDSDHLKSIHKVKGPSFTNIDTLVSDSNYIEESLTSGSSISIIRKHQMKKKSIGT